MYSRSSRTLESLAESKDPDFSQAPALSTIIASWNKPSKDQQLNALQGQSIHEADSSKTAAHPLLQDWVRLAAAGPSIHKGGDEDEKPTLLEVEGARSSSQGDRTLDKTYTCLLGTCTPSCGFPCFNTHHFRHFQTNDIQQMETHLVANHKLSISDIKIPKSWSDTYVHHKDGWVCPRCREFLGSWPGNQDRIEAHFQSCSQDHPGTRRMFDL